MKAIPTKGKVVTAIKQAIPYLTGDITLIQDADRYNLEEYEISF